MKDILLINNLHPKEKIGLAINICATTGLFVSSKVLENLFVQIPTLDISYHFLGGFLIAQGMDIITAKKLQTRWILERVAIVGVTWEIWEYLSGSPGSGITFDSTKDIIMDILGAYTYTKLSKTFLPK